MKDGIYRVTLKIEGKPIVAEGSVRSGVFQGLGELSGIVGVLALDDAEADRSAPSEREGDATEHGRIGALRWEPSDEAAIGSITSNRRRPGPYEGAEVDCAPLCIRRKTDIVSTATDRQRERAIRASLYVPLAWQDLRQFRERAGDPREMAEAWDEVSR
jgi:hypothetical protein